jgi:sugar phosphate isomerase/epimerase
MSPAETLRFARQYGLEGVQFPEVRQLDPDLDPTALRAIAALSDELDLYLEVGLACPNPVRRSRELGREVSPSELAAALRPELEAVALLGCDHARAYVGDRHDRFRTDAPWRVQLEATARTLEELAAPARDLGVRIAVENHADLTCDELLALVDRVGNEALAVTLDTGNLAMRLDDPVRSVERLAPLVVSTHVKDIVVALTERGLCWQARPVGSGVLPMPDLIMPLARANRALNLSIELHPRIYDLPIFDADWLSHFPNLRAADLASIVHLATICERRFKDGTLARPDLVEAIPWEDRDLDWLGRSVGYLRPVIELLRSL